MTMTINEALEAASMEALLDELAVKTAALESKTTQKDRRAAHKAALEGYDIDHLVEMQAKMRAAVDTMTANTFAVDNQGAELTESQVTALMRELLDQKDIEALLKARYEMIRTAIFAHITETLAAKGIPDPEYATGSAEAPEVGKRFAREGGKRKGVWDYDKLAEVLGEEAWNRVHVTKIVPERRVTELDEEALLRELKGRDLDVLARCATFTRTPLKLNIRNLVEEESGIE
jgi:hypothetical protein